MKHKMGGKQLQEQSLHELRRLRNIFEDESSSHPVATSVRSHIEGLGYTTKKTMDEAGDLTPEFGSLLKKVATAFKQKLPHLDIKFGSGRDLFHKSYPNSRHSKGNAIDVVFKGISKSNNDELDKISTLLCTLKKKYPEFSFIDEYRHPSAHATGPHYHFSYSANKKDEGHGTPQFCSSLKNMDNLEDIDFEKFESTKDSFKLDEFLDSIGMDALTDAEPGNKQSQKNLVDKVKELFSDDDVIDNVDGFEIFGYKLDDILDNVKSILPQFESEQKKKKNILEDIEKIKSKMIK